MKKKKPQPGKKNSGGSGLVSIFSASSSTKAFSSSITTSFSWLVPSDRRGWFCYYYNYMNLIVTIWIYYLWLLHDENPFHHSFTFQFSWYWVCLFLIFSFAHMPPHKFQLHILLKWFSIVHSPTLCYFTCKKMDALLTVVRFISCEKENTLLHFILKRKYIVIWSFWTLFRAL